MIGNHNEIEKRLWDAADQLRANSKLKSSEYSVDEIRGHSYSLNPGRYVGVTEKEEDDFDFYERLENMNEELEKLNIEARGLEERIAENVERLLNKEKGS